MPELIEDEDGAPYPEKWQPYLRWIMDAPTHYDAVTEAVGQAGWGRSGETARPSLFAIRRVLTLRLGLHPDDGRQ